LERAVEARTNTVVSPHLTVAEAAKRARVCEAIIRDWIKQGLPHFRLGAKGKRGRIRIATEDLGNWLSLFRVTKKEPEPRKAPAPKSAFKHLKLS
jgi:hypothetical protein